MKTSIALPLLCAATLAAAPNLIGQDQLRAAEKTPPGAVESVPDEILVGFHPGAAAAKKEGIRGGIGARRLKEFAPIGVQHWKLPPGLTVARAIEILTANPNVRFAEPNYRVHTNEVTPPNDLWLGELWGLHNVGQNGGTPDADIDALEAWLDPNAQGTGTVVVGVIDTGVDYTHPDLAGKMWVNPREIPNNAIDDDGNGYIDDVRGWDFVNDDNDPVDDNHHGTHVAGTIAAQGNNGQGVIGVAGLNPNVKLLPLKFLNSGGSGSTADAISAVLYAASLKDEAGNPAVRITNNSWSGGAYSLALSDAIAASNALFVAAAGNEGSSTLRYPGAYNLPNVIAVGATDWRDALASFSNYGSWVHIAAPGVSVMSSVPGSSYSRLNGTSMATPHVSGAAAMVLSQNPAWSLTQVKQRLLDTGDALVSLSGKTSTGKRLNVGRALAAADLPSDTPLPGAVANLVLDQATQTSLRVGWNAPSDIAGAYAYELRYRMNAPVSDANWNSSTPFIGEPVPQSGQSTAVVLENLAPGTNYYAAVKVFNRIGAASALSSAGPAQTLGIGWRTQLVDSVSDPLKIAPFVSLAFNPTGYPVLAYADNGNTQIKLATWTGAAWAYEAIGSDYGSVSLAMDASGKPTFAWCYNTLKFSAKPSSKWTTTTLDNGMVETYVPPSLVYNAAGNPAISYRSRAGSTEGLKFASRTGSTWKTSTIDGRAAGQYYTYGYNSLAFDPEDGLKAAVAYADDATDDFSLDTLKFATSTGTGWTIEPVDQDISNYAGWCSLAFSSPGNPVIADVAQGFVRVLRKMSYGSWAEQVVDRASSCDLCIKDGNAYLAYVSEGQLKLATALLPTATDAAAEWIIKVADFEASGSGRPSIKLGPGSIPQVSYVVGGKVRLTKEDPSFQGPVYVAWDSMEDGISGWVAEGALNDPTSRNRPPGPPTPNALWHQTARRASDAGHSAVTSWYYGIDAQNNYDTGSRNWGRLKSAPITLPAGSRAELNVSQLVLAEGGGNENGEIQISVNGGAWTTLFKRASRTDASFITDTVDLSAYLNKTIRIGFFFDTKDGTNNQYEGWYVDDVSVKCWP